MSRLHGSQQRGSRDLYSWLCTNTTGLTPKEAIDKTFELLRIPNLNKRSGLRKLHRRFPELTQHLNDIFDAAHVRHNMHLVDAIVNVWAKICPDAVLCQRLLEGGVLPRMLKILSGLVDVPRTLVSLSLIAQYGDDDTKDQILRGAAQLVYAMSRWRYPDAIEHAMVTLSHCLESHYFDDRTEPGMLQEVPFPFILSTTMDRLLVPPAPSPRTVMHALPILMLGAEVLTTQPDRREEATPILELLAVLIRSPDIALRCAAMWLFSHLYPEDEVDPSDPNPQPHATMDNTEEHMSREYCQMEASSQDFVVAIWDLLENKDLLQFGTFLAHVIQRAQYLYVGGFAPTPEDFENAELPFTTWEESLTAAAALLRQEGELDDADVLELEYLTIVGPQELAASRAQEVMARNPQHVHAHLVFCTTSQDREACFQVAIRGAELKDVSPFWRRQLLVTATEMYGSKAWNLLLSAPPSDWRRRRTAEEYLKAQLKHAETFVSVAPPDSRDLPFMIDCYVTCLLVLRGPQLSEDLAELEPLLQILELSQTELKKLEYPVAGTGTTKGHKALAQHFRTGIKKHSSFVKVLHTLETTRAAQIPHSAASWSPGEGDSVQWAGWLEDVAVHTLAPLVAFGPLVCPCRGREDDPRVEISTLKASVTLYRCSCCSKTSALVKRCGGCEHAWYCDENCQRENWPEHRGKCEQNSIQRTN